MQIPDKLIYQCHAYHDDLPNGKASGKVEATSTGLVFTIGDERIKVPYSGCKLEIGGANDRILFIRHAIAKGWTFYSNDRRILEDPLLKEHPELLQQVKRVKTKRQKHFVVIALALFLVIGTPAFLVFRMDWISAQVARQIPPEWEASLGESAIQQYTFNHELLNKKEAEKLLEPLIRPLLDQLPDSRYEYRFHIAMDSSLNAFALPGGFVVIHTQLILEADNAEELLGVLAHEMTHVEQQHGIRNIIGAAGIYTVVSAFFGDVSGIFATIAGAVPFFLNQSYSRDFERESDKKGFALLEKANIDPRGLATFFEKLMNKEKEMLEKIDDTTTRQAIENAMKFLSTHPASEERIEYLQKLGKNAHGDYINLEEHFIALQEAVKHFVAENDNDTHPEDEIEQIDQEETLDEN